MDATQQSQQPDQPAAQTAPLAKESPPASGAALAIRLWRTQDVARPVDLSWTSGDPAVSLATDLVAAGDGAAPVPSGNFLLAAFPGIQPAVLTARRLQWALQGLAQAERFAGTSAAILVHSASDLPVFEADSAVPPTLENAAPGQILLTPQAAELLRDLPGLPMQAASEAGLCELLWRDARETPARSSDEEALSRFIQLNGLENEAPAPPQQPAVPSAEPQPTGPDRGSSASPVTMEPDAAGIAGSGSGGLVSRRRGNQRLILGSAVAAAILLAVALIFAVSHKGAGKPEALEKQPASSTPALQPSAGLPARPAAATNAVSQPQHPKPSEPASNSRKHAEPAQANPTAAEAVKTQANPPAVPAGHCDLDSNLLPKMLEQAERSREQGNYPSALRQFRAVLACEPGNARARSGLDLTELAVQHR